MFVCTFQDYMGFGETLSDAWDNLRGEMVSYDFPELQPEDCRFFKQIEVEIKALEFDIQEVE